MPTSGQYQREGKEKKAKMKRRTKNWKEGSYMEGWGDKKEGKSEHKQHKSGGPRPSQGFLIGKQVLCQEGLSGFFMSLLYVSHNECSTLVLGRLSEIVLGRGS